MERSRHTHDIELFQVICLESARAMPETHLATDPTSVSDETPGRNRLRKLTVKPSAFFSISCFHCIKATTGATTRLGFFRGSDSNSAIVWIL